jgi:hypothetical protein
MKIRVFFLAATMIFLSLQSSAAVYWIGNGSFGGVDANKWENASNWFGGVVPSPTDDVEIGTVFTYTNAPILNSSVTINSLTIGVSSSGSLTVNSGFTLTVTHDFTIKYGNASATIGILGQTVSGTLGGTITCNGSFKVGDGTLPVIPSGITEINVTNTATVNIDIKNFNVAGSLILNTTSKSGGVAAGSSSNVNNPVLNLNNGRLRVTQNVQTTNTAYVNTVLTGYPTATNTAKLLVNPLTTGITGSVCTFAFGGTLSIATGGSVDFYGSGPGTCTTNYLGSSAQAVYSNSTTGLGTSPAIYQNLIISGAGAKNMQAGDITVAGDWTSSGGKIDAVTGPTNIYFQGSVDQSLTDNASTGNMIFSNVFFQGAGTKTITSGKFYVAGTGVLTMAGTARLAAGGNLTLLSNATGSATVAALPLNTSITGNVNVQRFIKGSSSDLSKRGYRLISSAVYTATTANGRCFDLRYLLDSAYVSGAAGGGFNAPSLNPTLLLYREDIIPSTVGPTSGNWKGIAKINNTNAYDIGTQQRPTTANIADTTINLSIGNGVMFYFRGNLTNNTTQSGSKVAKPYDYPEDVAFLQTGQLNTGTVDVKPWYTAGALSYTNSGSFNNTAARGYALIGNPYASTINFEKFNRNGANSSIYGAGFPAASVTPGKIWFYNSSSKQFDSYLQTPSISSVTDTTTTINPGTSMHTGDASNMIASGQGFFIKASAVGQTISFRETAKTNTQQAPANTIRLMDVPVSTSAIAFSSATVDVPAVQSIPILSFKLIKDSINTDDVVLAFNDHTANTFSDNDDVEDMNGNGALVSLSLISSDSIAAAIKQLKLPQNGTQTIALLANATASGSYQLKLNYAKNLPASYRVWLLDNLMSDSLDIKNNNTYSFNIDKNNAASYGRNRFKIVVRQDPALAMHKLSFSAIKTEFGAQVSWQTENESTDYIFNLEKSTNKGKTFTQIAKIESNGAGLYSFLDTNPVKGENQYRVKSLNVIHDSVSYSGIAKLMYADTANIPTHGIAVYPNPASDIVNIKMISNTADPGSGSYRIKISNSSGRLIKDVTSAQPYWQENIAGLLPGTYIVQIMNLQENKIQGETKFVKL